LLSLGWRSASTAEPPAVADANYQDDELAIDDLVDDPVVADAQTIAIGVSLRLIEPFARPMSVSH
jgi:hypothetical protein